MPSLEDLQQQIFNHNRRLQIRKEQEAQYGALADPSIVIEIKDIEAKLDQLNAEAEALRQEFLAEANAIRQLDLTAVLKNIPVTKQPHRVFISYKRRAQPDEALAHLLHQSLTRVGHRPFIDQQLPIGVEWAAEIEHQIKTSDDVVVFLSEASVNSEMVAKEIEHAHHCRQETGKTRLLPIRIRYTKELPYQLSQFLDRLQYAEWNSGGDTIPLVKQLLAACDNIENLKPSAITVEAETTEIDRAAPRPYADPRFIETLHDPSGVERLRSEFYIERDGDIILNRELSKQWGTTITIRAPRQTGKSSLLIRGIAQARQHGARDVLLDLQAIDQHTLTSLDIFLRHIAETVVAKLRLNPVEVAQQWQSALGPSDKLTYLLENYVLPIINSRLILAIDEADILLGTSFRDSFFGLLRSWHNRRATDEIWERLDIVLVISTEPHLLIKDINQSPFNVGLPIRLQDFNLDQIHDLNQRYRSPVTDADLPDALDYLGGHPYLTRRALYTLVNDQLSWLELKQIAPTDQSPFGDHLRRYLWFISQQQELKEAMLQIIQSGVCPDEISFYRLLRAGLITGSDHNHCASRCRLYAVFLEDKL